MAFVDAYKAFRAIEDELQLFEMRIQGFPVWDFLRLPVWSQIHRAIGFYGRAHVVADNDLHRLVLRLRIRAAACKGAVLHNPLFARPCNYLFVGHARRKMGGDATYWDLYSDPLVDYLGREECLVIEDAYKGAHAQPSHTQRLAYGEVLEMLGRVGRMQSFHLDSTETDAVALMQVQRILEKAFDVQLDIAGQLCQKFERHHKAMRVYCKVLRRVRPRVVFLVCSYGKESIIAACRQCGIPTVELQHGVLSRYHLGYSYPFIGSKSFFPDYFFSFGEFWEENASLPIDRDRQFTIGYPYFEMEVSDHLQATKQDSVLFISQGTIGESLSRFAVGVARNAPKDWRIVYKLHPGEVAGWKTRMPWLVGSGIDVIAGDCPPLYRLMAEAKVLVGVYSTAVFEGLAFGCETYVVELPGVEHVLPLVDCGAAQRVKNPEEVRFASEAKSSSIKEHVFAGNWQANVTYALGVIESNRAEA